jgi:hypothetical protein
MALRLDFARARDALTVSLASLSLASLSFALMLSLVSTDCRGQAQDAQALRASVDSLLPYLERLSGLPARNQIKLARRTRAEVRQYVEHQLAKEMPPAEMAGIQATYAALGLIPDTLNLRELLIALYTEQVAGYYDPETKTFYVVEGTPRETLKPVLAHELVHALQDQHVNLDSLISNNRDNDRQAAAQAAIEGQATVVMFAVIAEQMSGKPVNVATLPDLGAQLRPALEQQNEQFPVFRSAPRIIRETLLFPYLQGAAFVQALWRAHPVPPGRPLPAPLDSLMPHSTEQVMLPESRFFDQRDEPTSVALAPAAAESGWKPLLENTLGELETSIILRRHLGVDADALAHGWDGDRFRLLEKSGVGRALVWVSVWDDEDSAERFASAYRRILAKRPVRHGSVTRSNLRGRPIVTVIDADFVDIAQVPVPQITRLNEGVR